MKRITKNRFYKFLPDEVFASGESTDSETGLYVKGSGKEIHWIALKGKGKDWAVYYAWSAGEKFIRDFGEKLHDTKSVGNLLEVDDEVLALYRK